MCACVVEVFSLYVKLYVSELCGSGICGVAVISAIFGAEDIENATAELKALTERVVNI